MSDLISRSALLKRLEMISKNCKANKAVSKYIGKQIFDISETTVEVCIREAKNVPAVDAVPVVHGRWVKYEHYPPECSVCGGIAPKDCEGEKFYQSDFCQSCGAKMDEGDADV